MKRVLALVMVLGVLVTSSNIVELANTVREDSIDIGYEINEERDFVFLD